MVTNHLLNGMILQAVDGPAVKNHGDCKSPNEGWPKWLINLGKL